MFQQYVAGDTRAVLVLNSRRQILEMNRAARQMFAFHAGLPVIVTQVIHDMKVSFAIGDAIHDRRALQHEAFMTEGDRILLLNIVPIQSPHGSTSHVLVAIEDVTRLRHLETVRRDFVANVSHELRTPIASINLLTETLQNGGMNDPEAAAHFLRRIGVETRAMSQLVEELLALSRLESGRVSLNAHPFEVTSVVDEVRSRLAMMAEEKGIELRADVPEGLPKVEADFGAIEQVLMNLVHNAVKFTEEGGTVTVRARRHGPGVEVEVVDTGIGMDPEVAARVLERFYKADKGRHRGQGTGLGLAIARHLLDLHGSKLQVVSEPGHGSRLSFALSAAE